MFGIKLIRNWNSLQLLLAIVFLASLGSPRNACARTIASQAPTESARDTIRDYSVNQGVVYFPLRNCVAVASRFSTREHQSLHGVRVTVRVDGDSGRARLRILGPSGGASVPLIEQDLTEPQWIRASHSQFVQTTIEFSEPVRITSDQFFVVVDSLDGLVVLSDAVVYPQSCLCPTDIFVKQCLRRPSGAWESGPHAFLIEPIIERLEADTSITFIDEPIGKAHPVADSRSYSLLVGDLNGDRFPDIFTSETIVLGPLTQGSVAQLYAREGSRNLGDRPLVSSVRVGGTLHAVLISAGSQTMRVEEHLEQGISVLTVNMPGPSPVVSSVAIVDPRTGDEFLAIGRTRTAEIQESRVVILRKTGNAWNTTTAETPTGLYLNGLFAKDVDRDGEVDLLLVSTDQTGRPKMQVINFRQGQPALSSVEFDVDASATSPPVIAMVGQTAISDSTLARSTAVLLTVSNAFARAEQRGPGIEVLGSNIPFVGKDLQLVTLPFSARPPEPTSYFDGVDWLDRASSISFVDIDLDGSTEMYISSSDSCRAAQLYKRSVNNGWERLRVGGLESLSGAQDVAWIDLDMDGRVDAVGMKGGRLHIAWNRSAIHDVSATHVEIPRTMLNSVSTLEVRDAWTTKDYTGSTGRGRNIHERLPLVFLSLSDTIVVTRGANGHFVEVSMPTKVNAVQDDKIKSTDACRVDVSPNPFHGQLDFVGNSANQVDISVMAVDGRIVWSATLGGQTSAMRLSWNGTDTEGHPVGSGVYNVRVQSGSCVNVTKIVRVQ